MIFRKYGRFKGRSFRRNPFLLWERTLSRVFQELFSGKEELFLLMYVLVFLSVLFSCSFCYSWFLLFFFPSNSLVVWSFLNVSQKYLAPIFSYTSDILDFFWFLCVSLTLSHNFEWLNHSFIFFTMLNYVKYPKCRGNLKFTVIKLYLHGLFRDIGLNKLIQICSRSMSGNESILI